LPQPRIVSWCRVEGSRKLRERIRIELKVPLIEKDASRFASRGIEHEFSSILARGLRRSIN
jgi:hypothetical protein